MKLCVEVSDREAVRLLSALVAVELLFIATGIWSILVGDRIATVRVLFDMDAEGTIPAWFSSVQLFAIGLLLALCAAHERPTRDSLRLPLMAGAVAFIFLSMDEAAEFHEKFSWVLGDNVPWLPRFRTGYGIWMYLYAPAAVAVVVWLARDLRHLWNRCRPEFLLVAGGVAITLAGAMGLEAFGYLFLRDDMRSLAYRSEVVVEEFLEMLGMSVVLCGVLRLATRLQHAPPDSAVEPAAARTLPAGSA